MSTTETTQTVTPVGLDTSNPIQLTDKYRLLELEAALASRDPMIKNHLAEIHKHLIQYEEITHLLSDDEIAVLMKGQQIHTNVTLVGAITKNKTATAKKAAKLGID